MSTSRLVQRPIALLLTVSLLAITAGVVSAAPANPTVSVVAGAPSGGAVTITVTVNRAINQIASCVYGLDAAASIACPDPVSASKTTTYTIELTSQAAGDHTVDVAVTMKNGGVGTGSASFSVVPAPPRMFAVAFSDTNGNHTYEDGTDRLIAALVDANEDGTVSVGDTVETDAFPLSFDPIAGFGEFGVKSATVTSVTGFTSESVQVTSTSTLITWAVGSVDVVQWLPVAGGPESVLVDNTNPLFGQTDIITIDDGAGLGAVPSDVMWSTLDPTDNAHLDVALDLP